MTIFTLIFRILLSTLLSGLVGLEREKHECVAGLRTHILVCIGSALFMLTSIYVAENYQHLGAVDPSRIASGVVTGIGFLGAGAIIRFGATIRGLTTAASIWAVSAIGISVGAGMYLGAIITTLVVLCVLILYRLEEATELKPHGKRLEIVFNPENGLNRNDFEKIVIAYGGVVKFANVKEDNQNKIINITMDLIIPRFYSQEILREVQTIQGVQAVKWI